MTKRRTTDDKAVRDETSLIRLHKLMAHAGVGSRRACEDLIASGAVTVNGRTVVSSPVWVDPAQDEVTVSGKRISMPSRMVYVMLYKPKKTVSTVSDPSGRRTVSDLVEHPSGERLYPVGRLDYDTLGLVLMTNDGELANRLTHPRYGVHKTYRAVVKGVLSDEDAEDLEKGIYLAQRKQGETVGGERLGAAEIVVVRREAERTHLNITLTEGRNRQIRRLLAAVDCPVRKLTRIKMGPVSLKGLRVGEWRELTTGELRALRRASKPGGGGTGASRPKADRPSAGASRRPRRGAGGGGASRSESTTRGRP
jgi:pseudouridine synthase